MTEPKEDGFVASAHSTSGETKYVQSIRLGHHTISADEPEALGGQDKGPAPFALLLGSLAACTAITLEMYAGRKSWDLGTVKIDLRMFRGPDGAERVERRIAIEKPLTDDQAHAPRRDRWQDAGDEDAPSLDGDRDDAALAPRSGDTHRVYQGCIRDTAS